MIDSCAGSCLFPALNCILIAKGLYKMYMNYNLIIVVTRHQNIWKNTISLVNNVPLVLRHWNSITSTLFYFQSKYERTYVTAILLLPNCTRLLHYSWKFHSPVRNVSVVKMHCINSHTDHASIYASIYIYHINFDDTDVYFLMAICKIQLICYDY